MLNKSDGITIRMVLLYLIKYYRTSIGTPTKRQSAPVGVTRRCLYNFRTLYKGVLWDTHHTHTTTMGSRRSNSYTDFPSNPDFVQTVNIPFGAETTTIENENEGFEKLIVAAPSPYLSYLVQHNIDHDSDQDIEQLGITMMGLCEGQYYYTKEQSRDAQKLLSESPVGTFLVRNSANPSFLFTLSIVTEKGPTSIRTVYEDGLFSMDGDRDRRRSFKNLIDLIQNMSIHGGIPVVLDNKNKEQFMFRKPLLNGVPSLKHTSRVAVNRSGRFKHTVGEGAEVSPDQNIYEKTLNGVGNYLGQYTHSI